MTPELGLILVVGVIACVWLIVSVFVARMSVVVDVVPAAPLAAHGGLQFIPGDVVSVIEPGVPRKRWRTAKVQHVKAFRTSEGVSHFGYMVDNVYYRADQLEGVLV